MSRFSQPQDPDFQAINASLDFDWRLWRHDVAQSRAHAAMLASIGVHHRLRSATSCWRGWTPSPWSWRPEASPFSPDDEDIHMAIERRLIELAGRVGGKLHTARSRNDQVATDVVMFVREASETAQAALAALIETLLVRAERHLDWPMPGYTHLQRAQPVYLGHHLLAYVWMFLRDRQRFDAVTRACACCRWARVRWPA